MTPARITVEELSKIAAQGDEATFVSTFPEPALVVASSEFGTESTVDTPAAGVPTEKFFGRTRTFDAGAYRVSSLSEAHEGDASSPPEPKMIELVAKSAVVFLKKTERSPFPNMVTLGRARNNDVVVPLRTISKVHATFTHDSNGWRVTDERSANGTIVDDAPVQPGTSALLSDGSVIRLGPEVKAKFFTPAGIFGFLTLFRSGRAS